MHGERPNRLDLPRPYLFTFLIVALILAVTGTSGAAARPSGLPTSDFELGAETVLAVLAALGLTRLHLWQEVGFRPSVMARDVRLHWVLLFPVPPVVAAAVSGLTTITVVLHERCRQAPTGVENVLTRSRRTWTCVRSA